MTLDGRIDPRVSIVMPLYLLDAKRSSRPPELVLTQNVSATGARLLTKWRREPGDQERLTLLSGDTTLSAEVVYCFPVAKGSYCLGLKLLERSAGWWDEQAVPPRITIAARWEQMCETIFPAWAKSRS